eukprot:CAMPEP_0197000198 /NCGR_PEP_ID=MMETSP1380-20130617/5195_1 /TAXON_ID=5936 /ORGANISM="Euplotes crassus, Strain CT5" /LENGTH=725 /DNA_ID=CAMNT_0042417395 /DNA_START=3 /DNA_END=2180 /DNA_ORIENTATION=+
MRLAFNKGKDRIINSMGMTEQILRLMPGKNKRHTIKRPILKEVETPKSATDTFYEATKEILPKIEESIERTLLAKYIDTFGNSADKKEIYEAYMVRKDDLEKLEEKAEDFIASPSNLDPFEPIKVIRKPLTYDEYEDRENMFYSYDGEGLSYHTFDTIGKYTIFPESHWKRMFPRESPGQFDHNDFNRRNIYALMCTEENLKLTYDLARKTLPKDRKIDYADLIKRSSDMKEILKDEVMFVQLYQDFCLDLLDVMKERDPKGLSKVYDSPSIFDGVVGILLRELRKKPIRNFILYQPTRKKIMNDFTDMLEELFESKDIFLKELKDVIELRRILEITLTKADLGDLAEYSEMIHDEKKYKIYLQGHQKYCFHFWRPEDMREYSLQGFKGFNTGCFVWGRSGSGKSGTLAYATAWAHENNWVVISIPRARKFTDNRVKIERHINGLYVQEQLAKELLEDLRISNLAHFEKMPVDLNIYGKMDKTGVHDNELATCHTDENGIKYFREYDPKRRVWNDAWKEHLTEFELKQITKDTPKMLERISHFVKEPKTLLEIADYGIEHPEQATCAIAEIVHQLYNTDEANVMVMIDGYTEWFRPSEYTSFRYANSGYFIPPHDIAIPRLFMKFDGHKIRNGVKICAATQESYFNHKVTPEMIESPKCYNVEMGPLHLNEFRNAVRFFQIDGKIFTDIKEWRIEQMHMESQGYWKGLYESYFKTISHFDYEKRE